jgi:hypothetical protein
MSSVNYAEGARAKKRADLEPAHPFWELGGIPRPRVRLARFALSTRCFRIAGGSFEREAIAAALALRSAPERLVGYSIRFATAWASDLEGHLDASLADVAGVSMSPSIFATGPQERKK